MKDTIMVTPLTIRLKVRLPRFCGLRLRVTGWLIALASKVAGDTLEIEVQEMDEDWIHQVDEYGLERPLHERRSAVKS